MQQSGQNPPFEHHKNEATEEKGTPSTRAKQTQTFYNTNNNITKRGITETKLCHKSLSGGKEQNHHNGFSATLKQSSNYNKKNQTNKGMSPQKH